MSTDFTYDFSYSRRQSSEQSDGVARADSSTDFAEGRKHSSSEYSYENGWGSGSTSGHRHGGGGGGGGGRSWRGGYSGGRHGGGGGGGKGGGRSGGHGGKGGRGGRKGGGGKGAHHSKYSKHFTYDEKVYLLLNKISKGPVGWRNELDVFGKGRWDHKNCSIFVAAESQGDADAAGMLLQEQAKHAEAIVQHPTLETRVATSHDVRVQLGHGFDVRKVVWQRADSATVHFTLPVLDVRPIRFQRVESPRMINASLTALLGVYGQVLQEKVPADLGLSEKVKAQLACVMCVQEFLGVHQIMRVDMVEVRKVLSAAQELLLSPDSKLPRPAGFRCSTKNVKYDKTNFRVLTTAGDGEESAPVEADCGVFVDGTLVLPAGATIVRKSRDDGNGGTEAVWVVVKPACEFEAADGCASTGFKLMQALYKQGCSHYRATRDVSKGVYTGRIHMASSEEAEKFVGIDTFVGPYKLVKSMVPPDVTKEGLDLPISMSFVQVKRLHSYFEERVEELQKLIASDRQVQVKLEAGMGQYMIRVKGSNAATVEEIGEYIREFIIKGVVISTAEESRLEEVGFDYTKMVTLRMKSRSVNAIEKRLRLNDEPCAVAVAGNGNETITYVTGRGAQTVAEEIRKIIHDRQTRVALQTSEPMEDVHRVAKKYGCKVNGNAVGSSSLVGLAEDIVVAEAELKKVYDVECAICRCEETAYTSSCAEKHTICRVCIEDWIVHAMQNNDFPLRCPGCLDKTPMLLHDVQQMLTITSKTVEDLVRPALRAYMSAHHDEVRCCSTVDCSGVVPQGKGMYACVECTRMQCTTCNNENHWDATLTCEEAKEMNLSEGDKKTRDVIDSLKACPRCKLKVEKSTGCNAVRCVCGAGFCWLCGEDCGTDAEAHHHFGKQGTPCYAKLFEGVYSNDAE